MFKEYFARLVPVQKVLSGFPSFPDGFVAVACPSTMVEISDLYIPAVLAVGFALDLWVNFFPFARTMHGSWTNLM